MMKMRLSNDENEVEVLVNHLFLHMLSKDLKLG